MRRKRRSKKHNLMLRVAAFVLAGLLRCGYGGYVRRLSPWSSDVKKGHQFGPKAPTEFPGAVANGLAVEAVRGVSSNCAVLRSSSRAAFTVFGGNAAISAAIARSDFSGLALTASAARARSLADRRRRSCKPRWLQHRV